MHWNFLQGLEKEGRLLSEEVNSLRSQLERTREEKAEVEDQLSDTQVMLAQEQEDHRQLQHSRAREAELWSDERETSLSLVKEMTREVSSHYPVLQSISNEANVAGGTLKKSKGGAQSPQLQPAEF